MEIARDAIQGEAADRALAVKAGPKKRRAKTERERIEAAIEDHGARGVRQTRRASKLRVYKYKEPAKKKAPKRKLSLDPRAEGLNDRSHRPWETWEEAILFSEPTKVLDDLTKKQMLCEHKALKVEKPTAVIGSWETREYRICPTCQAFLRWWGNYTATIQAEWQSLRLDGYSMPEWGELFTKDKSLWVFIMEEAHVALSDKED